MKKALLAIVLVLAAAGLILAYLQMRQERDREAAAEAPIAAPSRVERNAEGATGLRLDAATQTRLGLQTAVPPPGSVTNEFTAAARVLDGAVLARQLNELRAAQAMQEASRVDFERKKKLFENGQNASAGSVEQAAALVTQHMLALEAARDRITCTWSRAIAERVDLPSFARALLHRESTLVRVDLLPSDKLDPLPSMLRLLRQNGEELAPARVLGPAASTESALAGQSLLCLVGTNAGSLVPGATLLARLATGVIEQGMLLPRSAVVRHAGLGWAYVQTGAETFTRRAVPLDHPHPKGWLVNGEWTLPVIVTGAQSLLSEELKGRMQMKD